MQVSLWGNGLGKCAGYVVYALREVSGFLTAFSQFERADTFTCHGMAKCERLAMDTNGSRELAVLDHASRMLEEASSLEDVKVVRDKAEAARIYARAAKLGLQVQNRAAELKLRAERRAGQFLATLKLRGGDRRSKGRRVTLKLEDLGISRQQSKRWQAVASVSEREFLDYVRKAGAEGRELTSAGLIRLVRRTAEQNATGRGRYDDQVSPLNGRRKSELVVHDIICELRNHCMLLTDVLQPVYQGGERELKSGERRVIGRLLNEMSQLIRDLDRGWPRESDTFDTTRQSKPSSFLVGSGCN